MFKGLLVVRRREKGALFWERNEKRFHFFSFPPCPSQLIPAFPIPANKSPTPKFHLNTNGPLSYCQSVLICCDTNRSSTPWNGMKASFQNYRSLSHLQREIARNCTKWLKCNHVSSLFNVQSCSHALSHSPAGSGHWALPCFHWSTE